MIWSQRVQGNGPYMVTGRTPHHPYANRYLPAGPFPEDFEGFADQTLKGIQTRSQAHTGTPPVKQAGSVTITGPCHNFGYADMCTSLAMLCDRRADES